MRSRAVFMRLSALLFALAMLLSSCGGKRARVAKPPRVGKTETGVASWYGPPYHGRRSANGEVYDMERLTAAHRTFTFDTWVRVKNLSNGKEVDVRITDRGPFVRGRIIDLSKAAARRIDMIGPGIAKVKLKVIDRSDAIVPQEWTGAAAGSSSTAAAPPPAPQTNSPLPGRTKPPLPASSQPPVPGQPGVHPPVAGHPAAQPPLVGPPEPPPPPPPVTAESFGVQIGAFRDHARAERLRVSLEATHGRAVLILRDTQIPTWRVVVGSYETEDLAASAAASLRREYPEAFVVRQDAPLPE